MVLTVKQATELRKGTLPIRYIKVIIDGKEVEGYSVYCGTDRFITEDEIMTLILHHGTKH